MAEGLMSRSRPDEKIWQLWNFKTDAKIETKICHDNFSFDSVKRILVLSTRAGNPETALANQFLAFTFEIENILLVWSDYNYISENFRNISSQSGFHSLTFSLALWVPTSTFTAFPMFPKTFRCLEHSNNCFIFSVSGPKWPDQNKLSLYSKISLDSW